ncbi:cell division protein FtsP [Pectobacterium versatile]|uniref:cell division protein FtsP n=1 Tax=Pectobacterium versatile TaxID=2488639 RepID=UPI0015DF1474|nr:cell division protein FtsP [Pectobacterium versatile]MBA0163552.1 cell division protein FtsP [Pectobacterium versatile]MBN3062115.1 cell division protein FtsP [Pectobacterium versatile]
MSFSRRQFIQASGLALCAGMTPLAAKASGNPSALPIPPLLESRRGQPLFLTMQRAHWAFSGDRKTSIWGINGHYLGPTVRVYDGDDVKLIYSNRLNEPVAMTIGGLQVPGPLMGGAARIISPGTDWSPVLPVRQPAATCWYHANTPNRMAPHIYNGLAGLWLVEDSVSKSLPLPNHYGVDDFPLIIQDKRLDNFGVPLYNPPSNGGFVGDSLLVNGVQNPFIEVSRGWVRLRLLNASNSRRYVMRLSDGRAMHVIASDQGLLPAPMAVNQLSLAPGERREILVDMSQGEEVTLTAGESAGIMDRLRGLFEPSSILISTQILTLKPTGLLPLVTDNLPMRLLADNIIEGSISRTREFRLGDSLPGINGAMWDMTRADVQTQLGRCERWIIHADTPQAFHIQGVKFLVRSASGRPPAVEDSGWKDTVWVDSDVELLVYFMQPSSMAFPFLYYSQTLELADRGSTGQLIVQSAM